MTQTELRKEIEDTREVLNTALVSKCSSEKVLEISRMLDDLIEKYLTETQQKSS